MFFAHALQLTLINTPGVISRNWANIRGLKIRENFVGSKKQDSHFLTGSPEVMHLVEEGEVVPLEAGVGRVADGAEVLHVGRGVALAGNPDHPKLRTLFLDFRSLAAAVFRPHALCKF